MLTVGSSKYIRNGRCNAKFITWSKKERRTKRRERQTAQIPAIAVAPALWNILDRKAARSEPESQAEVVVVDGVYVCVMVMYKVLVLVMMAAARIYNPFSSM